MRLLAIDLETTGLDLEKDCILKLGMVLVDTTSSIPLFEKEWTLWHETYPKISKEAFEAHGIEERFCVEFGKNPIGLYFKLAQLLEEWKVEYLVAHNGNNFDYPMLDGNVAAFDCSASSIFRKFKKVDTAQDIPFPPSIQTRKLTHLAAEHGFLNPFPHSALSDIRTMLQILSKYPLEKVLERSASPSITIHAKVGYEGRMLAKARRFYWDQPTQKWLKKIKECDLAKEQEGAEFEIVTI